MSQSEFKQNLKPILAFAFLWAFQVLGFLLLFITPTN